MSQAELGPKAPGSITIEQLLALNEEIRALVRAGVPLERGLSVAARELRGKLGKITRALGDRLARGESLSQALEGEKQSLPPLYRAVVEAGRGPAGFRWRLKGWRDMLAASPRLGPRSGWRFGIRFWSCRSRTSCFSGWWAGPFRVSSRRLTRLA